MSARSNPVISAAAIVFGFWWLFFTLRDFSMSPLEMIRNWAYIGYSMRMWVIGLFVGAGAAAWLIWWKRASANDRLRGRKGSGMVSTLGPVPVPVPPPQRASDAKHRLPIHSPLVQDWIKKNEEENPQHVALFMAVWDIYSKHRDWPATTRAGGHGGRTLWQHCLAVAETALTMAPNWKFEGVHVKVRGRKPKLIIAPSKADFVFDAEDPLIPLLALAHDIGKLEAYKRGEDGKFTSSEYGSTRDHDDLGVKHDALGARVLARLPEFWKLPASDRRILGLVIAHYHHPSAFPVDKHGLSLDDRMTALLEFLIVADRRTGMEESGLTQEDEDNELTEEATEELYRAFVEVVTEHGRINGIHGDAQKDKNFMIGSKHDGLIVVQELPLRQLLLAKLGMSLEEGEGKYRLTRNLLSILQDKGLLYTHHNGIDFARYAPMWEVTQRRTKDGGYICTWKPVIIFKPTTAARELDILVSLAEKKARLRIEKPLYTHNPNIRDVEALRSLIAQAFDPEIADSVLARVQATSSKVETGASATVTAAAVQVATQAPAPAPVQAPAPQVAATPVAPVNAAPAPVQPDPQPAPAIDASPSKVESAEAPSPAAVIAAPVGPEPVASGAEPPWEEQSPGDQDLAAAGHVDASDLPEVGADDVPLVGDDGEGSEESIDLGLDSAGAEGLDLDDDLFGDFPDASTPAADPSLAAAPAEATTPSVSAPPPAPAPEPARSDVDLKSPRDAALVAQLKAQAAPLIVEVPGAKVVKDEDAPRGRELGRSDKDKETLKALQALSSGAVPVAAPPRKNGKSKVTLASLQQLLASGAVPIGGTADGHMWVLSQDLAKHVKQLNMVIADLKLPSRAVGGGMTFVGVPLP